jgi:hypothetical protein
MGLPKTGLAPHLTPISYRDESDYRNTDHNQLAGDGRTRRWVAPHAALASSPNGSGGVGFSSAGSQLLSQHSATV